MRSVKPIVALAVVTIALAGCSRSSGKTESGGSSTTVASSPATVADFCAKVKGEVDAFDITGIAVKTPDELKHTYQNLAPRLEAIAAQAPAEIKGDFDTFVTLEKKVDDVLADADYDPKQLSLSALPELASPSTFTSLRHLGTFFRDECHFAGASG